MAVAAVELPLQALDPSVMFGAPPEVRAAASLVLTVAFGGAVIYRYGGQLDGAVDASMESPLVSVVYGLMAYGLVVFVVAYAYSQLARLGVGAATIGLVGGLVLAAGLLSLGGLGFVVVGAWLTETVGSRDPWLGLVGLAAVAAIAWLVLPVLLGLLVWLGFAAVGIGGPVRRWVHGSFDDPPSGEG
jgi:hypothetical protein